MIGRFVGGGKRLASWGGGFVAPGKTSIKKLYGKTGGHLVFLSCFLSPLSLHKHTQTYRQQLDAAESVSRAGNYTSWQATLEIWTDSYRNRLLQQGNHTYTVFSCLALIIQWQPSDFFSPSPGTFFGQVSRACVEISAFSYNKPMKTNKTKVLITLTSYLFNLHLDLCFISIAKLQIYIILLSLNNSFFQPDLCQEALNHWRPLLSQPPIQPPKVCLCNRKRACKDVVVC